MSTYSKSSSALKKKAQESSDYKKEESCTAEIIPWPDIGNLAEEEKKKKRRRIRLNQKFLYYKGKKIPILQFQKSGYDKLLKLLLKEIPR
jgi:hypothetical protein